LLRRQVTALSEVELYVTGTRMNSGPPSVGRQATFTDWVKVGFEL
jgi:hypothetical protein